MDLQFDIRPLEPADMEHLWTMEWDPLPRQIRTFYLLCTIAHPRYSAVAVDPRGRIVGVQLATPDQAGQWVYVNHLRIEPDCRGAGIGSALMKHLESQCRSTGVGRVWLLTSTDVEPFYAAMGYTRDSSFMPAATRRLMETHRPDTLILAKVL